MKIILVKDHAFLGRIKPKGLIFEVTRVKRDELVRSGIARDWPNLIEKVVEEVKQIKKRRK